MTTDRRRLYEDYKHYTDLEKLQERAKSLTQELDEIFAQDAAEQAKAAAASAKTAAKSKAVKE
jgi:glutathione-regulated potassium-efflux system protein KefB